MYKGSRSDNERESSANLCDFKLRLQQFGGKYLQTLSDFDQDYRRLSSMEPTYSACEHSEIFILGEGSPFLPFSTADTMTVSAIPLWMYLRNALPLLRAVSQPLQR
jgi:hypothetical protein